MKKLLFAMVALFGLSVRSEAFPIVGYVQITTGAVQSGGFSTQTGKVQSLTVSGLSPNQCVQTTTGGLLATTGAQCSAGGGGGASSLNISSGSASVPITISSPTVKVIVDSNTFVGSLVNAATVFLTLNPSSATLQGNTFNSSNQLVKLDSSSRLPAPNGITLAAVAGLSASTFTFTGDTNSWMFGKNGSIYGGPTAGNQTGQFQTCFGNNVCANPGVSNIGIGFFALSSTSGSSGNDIAIGEQALGQSSLSAGENIAIGHNAMASGIGPSMANNVAIGQGALRHLASYGECVAIGQNALTANTSGFENIAIGINSLTANTTGWRNIAVGNFSLTNNVSGISNTAVGDQAGGNVTNAATIPNPASQTMTFLGSQTGVISSQTVLNDGMALGNLARVGCSDCASLGNATLTGNYRVGIGTTTPAANLTVIGNSQQFTMAVGTSTSGPFLLSVSSSGPVAIAGATTIQGAVPLLSTSTLQSGTTFFVSSGTVSGSFLVTGNSVLGGIVDTAHFNTRGSVPSLSSCGATPAITTGSTDVSGQITEGTGSPTGCTVTFASAWTNAPFCVVQTTSTVTTATVSSTTNSQFSITTSVPIPSNTITYHCIGRD